MSQQPTEPLIKFMAAFESLHDGDLTRIGLQPKLCPAGYWTEGYGRVLRDANGKMLSYKDYKTIDSVLPFSTISTEDEALKDLWNRARKLAPQVSNRLKVPVTQDQFNMLISHADNCGFSDTLYKLINTKQDELKIKNWITGKYVTAGGVYMKGLQYRRNDEWQMWKGINYVREYNLSV